MRDNLRPLALIARVSIVFCGRMCKRSVANNICEVGGDELFDECVKPYDMTYI